MPILANTKHEIFAQGLAEGKTADAAYSDAGYRPDRSHAARLAANGRIVARVVELRGELDKASQLDRKWVLTKLMENAERSLQVGAGNVANRALELLGKHLGMFEDAPKQAEQMQLIPPDNPVVRPDWPGLLRVYERAKG